MVGNPISSRLTDPSINRPPGIASLRVALAVPNTAGGCATRRQEERVSSSRTPLLRLWSAIQFHTLSGLLRQVLAETPACSVSVGAIQGQAIDRRLCSPR